MSYNNYRNKENLVQERIKIMLYYSDEARNSAISSIHELIIKLGLIPGNILSYNDASQITSFLDILENEIIKEKIINSK